MFLAVVGCTSLIYALQTLYVNVDNKILRGGKHSMRHNVVLGVTWTAMHTPYHICLVLLATGLGIAFRDIIITPAAAGSASSARPSVGEAAHFVVRAAAKLTAPGVPHFTKLNRWLFSIGWGGSMLLSAMLSMMHFKGPRETTKYPRVLLRSAIAIGLGVGMPFTGVPAGVYLLVHSLVTSVISFTEFILVQVDAVDIIGSTLRGYDLDDAAHSDHSDHGIKAAAAGDENSPWPDTEAQKQRGEETINAQALRRRMSQKGRHRLEKVDVSNTKVYEQFSPRSLL